MLGYGMCGTYCFYCQDAKTVNRTTHKYVACVCPRIPLLIEPIMSSLNELVFPSEQVLTLPAVPPSYLKCQWMNKDDECLKEKSSNIIQNGAPLPFAASPVIMGVIDSAKCHTKGEDVKTVFELVIDVKGLNSDYLPGDTIGILPNNPEAEIISLMECLGLSQEAHKPLKIVLNEETTKKKPSVPNYLPPISTVFEILESCVDFRAVPKKLFLRALCEHTENPEQKRRLEELCSREGTSEYNTTILESGCSVLDIFEAFDSCKPPFSLLLEHLPRLQPRPYSIASSPLKNPEKVRIVLNTVVTPRGREGLCSGWLYRIGLPLMDLAENLKNLKISGNTGTMKVPLYLRKPTKFRIPDDLSASLLMVGPGTGLAPFLGFLQHRNLQYNSEDCIKGDNWLFFGCRYKDRDYIFKEELNMFVEDGTVSKLLTTFSRDNVSCPSTKYVQDSIQTIKFEFVNKLLDGNSYLFICGDLKKVVKDIEESIKSCIMDVKEKSATDAEKLYHELEKNGFIQKDTWL